MAEAEGAGAAKGRERLRGDGTELSWLMRTTYIANGNHERRQQKAAGKAIRDDTEELSHEAQIAAVEVLRPIPVPVLRMVNL